MSRTVTLSQLRTDIASQCDFSTSVSGRYPPSILNRLINQSIQRFRERISNEGMTHFLVAATGTLPAGPTATYAFQTLDLSALNPSLVRTYGIDITVAGVVVSLAHRPFQERNDFTSSPTMTGQPRAWAHFQTSSIAIMPAPDTAYPYTVWYLPVLADLVNDSDTFDGVAGWEVWVLWDCVCQLIARDQYATAYTQAIAERDLAWVDIVRSATKVSSAGGAHVGRDTMGQAGLWGRQPLRNISASAGGSAGGTPALSSVTNAMLVNRNGPIAIGRLSPLTGAVEDVPLPSLTSYMGKFAGGLPGLVPSGTGNTADSLRGDGTWGNTTTAASGLAVGQLAPIASPRVLGRVAAGSGAVSALLGVDVATMLPRFFGSGVGLVPAPTGALSGRALTDNGTWQTITGGGGGPTMLPAGPVGAVQYNAGSGFGGTSGLMFDPLSSALSVDGRFGLKPMGFPTGFGDKLAGWTASGFANVATGIAIAGSGMALAFGSRPAATGVVRFTLGDKVFVSASSGADRRIIEAGNAGSNDLTWGDIDTEIGDNYYDTSRRGVHAFRRAGQNLVFIGGSGLAMQAGTKLTHNGQALSASGFYAASKDFEGVRRINNVEGQKVFGDLSSAAATGIVSVHAGSGSVFHTTATVGQLFALQPSAIHGDAILLQNRSGVTHTVYNLGTGMGAPSGEIFKLNPSGAAWARFASGAWELSSRYQLGGA